MQGRPFVFPEPGDDLASIAGRVLPGAEDGARQLLSWNLHLAVRGPTGLLPSDIVFTKPPVAR